MQRDITDLFLQALRPPVSGRDEYHDSRVNGLTFRLYPSGKATWTVRARHIDGKRPQPSVGHWPGMSIREARKRARIMLGELASGQDPVAAKRQARAERAARAARPTVETQLAAWRAAKADSWSPRYAREIERLCTRIIIPQLGNRVLAETSRAQWITLIAAEREQRPATATWLYQLSSGFLNYAETAGWIDRPLLPRKGLSVIAPHAAPRERVLSAAELAAVWRATATRSPKTRAFVRLLIMTGCRVSEAAGLAWGELDPEGGQWTIPAARAKNGRALTVPLPAALLGEILALAPAACPPEYWLLGFHKNSPLQGISRIKTTLDRDSGVTDWVMHDLRRTVRTNLAALGISNDVAEACLNHVAGTRLQQTYNRFRYQDEILAALTRWQQHVALLVNPQVAAAA